MKLARIETLASCLPEELAQAVRSAPPGLSEIRLRAGAEAELVFGRKSRMTGCVTDARAMLRMAARMMDNSLYAREEELRQGFFTLRDGCRVGVAGRYAVRDGRAAEMVQIGAMCVRIAREAPGCAKGIVAYSLPEGSRPRGTLLLSGPGVGKTTCLRDLVRTASEKGWHVGLVDERGELAAVSGGVPSMDVGPRTDVMDGCPKALAIEKMVRSMSPDVIAVDELGSNGDAEAVLDAMRCGAVVFATAHAGSFEQAERRACTGKLMRSGAFPVQALLECVQERRRARIRAEGSKAEEICRL